MIDLPGRTTLAGQGVSPAAQAPEHILDAVAALCRPFPDVREVALFCHDAGQVFCMVSATSRTEELACALNGTATSNMVGIFIPVDAGFRCAKRNEGKLTVPSCDECRRQFGTAEAPK